MTGIVANNTQAVASSGTDDMILELIMSFSKSKTVFDVSISPQNSRLKARAHLSYTKSESMSAEYALEISVLLNSSQHLTTEAEI